MKRLALPLFALLVICFCLLVAQPAAAETTSPPDPRGAALPAFTPDAAALPLGAPGYCSSNGGSTTYESITDVSLSPNADGTYRLVVQVFIANPTGCSSGSPCPVYDNSPEYVNVWVDFNGDKTWSAGERVLDKALTGYNAINYRGTMTAVGQFTPPGNAVGAAWLRANLGWGSDPNDPCTTSWNWGNVVDKQVTLAQPKVTSITAEGVGVTGNQPQTGSTVRMSAAITIPSGYEITRCAWTGKLTPGEGDAKNGCRYEYVPATGPGPSDSTYGEKLVTLTITYKHTASGATGQSSKDHTYRVFFARDGDDDGDCASTANQTNCAPNWFEYWGDDGAVPQLTQSDVFYDPTKGANSYGSYSYSTDRIGLGAAAARTHYPNGISVPAITDQCPGGTFGGAMGIDCATEVVEHESRHKWVRHNWDTGGIWNGLTDSDRGQPNANFNDSLPDTYETGTSHTSPNDVDSCNLETYKNSDYARYGDNEWVVMMHSNGRTGVATNDWANPGKQTNPPSVTAAEAAAADLPAWDAGPAFANAANQPAAPEATDMGRLTGLYGSAASDTNSNGLYDYLQINVDVEIGAASPFNCVAWLQTSGGIPLGFANYSANLTPGVHRLPLRFPGALIRSAGYNGPYRVSHVELRSGDRERLADAADNVLTTAAYAVSSFEPPAGSLSGAYGEQPADTDGDGRYDQLRITTNVNIAQAGQYVLTGELVGNANVQAIARQVTLPAGTQAVTLAFDGKLIFQDRHTGPLQLRALRLAPVGGARLDFRYNAFTTSQYNYSQFENSGTLFAPPFSDQGLDTDGDGDFDYLRVRMAATAAQAGPVRVQANLEDWQGRRITAVDEPRTLTAGSQNWWLDFPGGPIYGHGINGPYRVTALTLLGPDGTVLDYLQTAHATQNYAYTNFTRPIVALTGGYTDQLVDANGNGLYDFLDIRVAFQSGSAGVVVAHGRLVDGTGREIGWAESTMSVGAGNSYWITLRFSGRAISDTQHNGPYYLRDLILYNTADPQQTAEPLADHATPAYSVTIFEKSTVRTYLPLLLRVTQIPTAEPNDSFETATGPLSSGATYIGAIASSGDRDYYYFDISTLGRIVVDVTNIPSGSDIDVNVYDASHVRVAGSWGVTSSEQSIQLPVVAGRYYIMVYLCCGTQVPTQPYHLRVTYNGSVGGGDLYGAVRAYGAPRANVPIALVRWDAAASSYQRVWTATRSDGYYHFWGMDSLAANQTYYAYYSSVLGSDYIGYWYTPDRTAYTGGGAAFLGDMDISPVHLLAPNHNATVTLPSTFNWTARGTSPGESYRFRIYDTEDSNRSFWSPSLGHTGGYTLAGLPAGFETQRTCDWSVYVEDASGGSGGSYYSRYVTFSYGLNAAPADGTAAAAGLEWLPPSDKASPRRPQP